jgi:hypothetical protein
MGASSQLRRVHDYRFERTIFRLVDASWPSSRAKASVEQMISPTKASMRVAGMQLVASSVPATLRSARPAKALMPGAPHRCGPTWDLTTTATWASVSVP